MPLQIENVLNGEFQTVFTNEEYLNEYRRFGPDHWEHNLDLHGWQKLIDCEEHEKAFEIWLRKQTSK